MTETLSNNPEENLIKQPLKNKLLKIPVLNIVVKLLSKIKLPGLKGLSLYDLLELYIIGIVKGALTARASAIAYSFFMALFPFLLFVIIVIPEVPIDDFDQDFLAFLESVLPPKTIDFFHDNIFNDLKGKNENGGLLSSVLLVAVFLMGNGVNALFSGFKNSYHRQLTRNIVKQYLYALGVALILVFLLIIIVAGFVYFQFYVLTPLTENGYIENKKTDFWASIAQYAFFVLMTYLATATLYYFGTKKGEFSKFFSAGALFTTVLIILMSYLFGIYIENFAKYNELYGSIGALLILLFYFWLIANILLLGFELNMSINLLKKRM